MSNVADIKAVTLVSIEEAFEIGMQLKDLLEKVHTIQTRIAEVTQGSRSPHANQAINAFQGAYPGLQQVGVSVHAGMTELETWYNSL